MDVKLRRILVDLQWKPVSLSRVRVVSCARLTKDESGETVWKIFVLPKIRG